MRWQYWIGLFIIAGLYGCVGEIVINTFAIWIRGAPLWLYYNGWHTSWESFILFGIGGVLAFLMYKGAKHYVGTR